MDPREFDRKYGAILHLPHHVSPKRQRMSLHDRAAQFAPFSALTGYDAVIRETARLTDHAVELTDSSKAILDAQLQVLSRHLHQKPLIHVTFFLPDQRKAGGEYITHTGIAAKLDGHQQVMLMEDGRVIPFEAIINLRCEISSPEADEEK